MADLEQEKRFRRNGQIAGLTIAAGAILSLVSPWLTAQLGLGQRFRLLLDLIALGAIAWAIFVAIGMWRKRRNEQ